MNIDRYFTLRALKYAGVATAVCDSCGRIVCGSCNRDTEVTYLLCLSVVASGDKDEGGQQEVKRPSFGRDVNEELKCMSGTEDISSAYTLLTSLNFNVLMGRVSLAE